MNLGETLRMAVGGIRANRLRSGLTMLGILIGVGAVILLVAVGAGSSAAVQARIESLGTNTLIVFRQPVRGQGVGTQSRASDLTLDDVKALRNPAAAPDIRSVAPGVSANVTASYQGTTYTPASFVGTTPEYADIRGYSMAVGSFITADDVTSHAKTAVIGQTVAQNLFGTTDVIGKEVKFNNATFTVTGLLAAKGSNGQQDQDDVVLAPYTAVQDSISGQAGTVSNISIQAASQQQMDAAAAETNAIMMSSHRITNPRLVDFRILNQATLLQTSDQTAQVFTVLLGAVAGISLLVGGIGVMNIMLVTVTERTREIGIRKAIGARRGSILGQFLVEAVLLAGAGGVLGVLVGIVGSRVQIVGIQPVVQAYSVVLALGVAIGVGLFFGIYPANRAANLRPIDALRFD
ncbi:MAG: ABC transporter permease [Acidimicrobiales bacterium]